MAKKGSIIFKSHRLKGATCNFTYILTQLNNGNFMLIIPSNITCHTFISTIITTILPSHYCHLTAISDTAYIGGNRITIGSIPFPFRSRQCTGIFTLQRYVVVIPRREIGARHRNINERLI